MISTFLPYIQIGLSALLIVAVLLQQTSGSIGGAFGGADNMSSVFHTRRGIEKIFFIGTIILGVLFALSAFVALILQANTH